MQEKSIGDQIVNRVNKAVQKKYMSELEQRVQSLEENLIPKKYTYDYPMFSLAVDIAVVDIKDRLLVIRRGGEVNTNKLALPGGFVDINETLSNAAIRELYEETGLIISKNELNDGLLLDDPDRDPRGRVVSHQFNVYLEKRFEEYDIKAGDDASDVEFHHLSDVPSLAFDHNKVVKFLQDVVIGGREF